METEKYMLHTIYKKVDELAQKLSSDFIKHLKTFSDYNNVVSFYVIAWDYALKIEERFFCEESDETDFEVLKVILHLYDTVSDLIVKYELENEITIEIDDNED